MWRSTAAQEVPIPETPGGELVLRCVICHSAEIAVQQRFGPQGWSETLDRMIKYGAPIPPEDKALPRPERALDYAFFNVN
jgi:hypothetical protein